MYHRQRDPGPTSVTTTSTTDGGIAALLAQLEETDKAMAEMKKQLVEKDAAGAQAKKEKIVLLMQREASTLPPATFTHKQSPCITYLKMPALSMHRVIVADSARPVFTRARGYEEVRGRGSSSG